MYVVGGIQNTEVLQIARGDVTNGDILACGAGGCTKFGKLCSSRGEILKG